MNITFKELIYTTKTKHNSTDNLDILHICSMVKLTYKILSVFAWWSFDATVIEMLITKQYADITMFRKRCKEN